jgi:hypothetical protein
MWALSNPKRRRTERPSGIRTKGRRRTRTRRTKKKLRRSKRIKTRTR